MRCWLRFGPAIPACVAALLSGCGGRSVVHRDFTDGGPTPKPQLTETVTCRFSGGVRATCRSHRGDECTGAGECTATVRGAAGEQLSWTSSCGGRYRVCRGITAGYWNYTVRAWAILKSPGNWAWPRAR